MEEKRFLEDILQNINSDFFLLGSERIIFILIYIFSVSVINLCYFMLKEILLKMLYKFRHIIA